MRRFQGFGFVIMLVVLALMEYYTFTALRFSLRNVKPGTRNIITALYIIITLAWIGSFFLFPAMRKGDMNKSFRNAVIIFSMGFLFMKLLIATVLLIDDARRFVFYISSFFYSKNEIPAMVSSGMSRSQFFNSLALLAGGTLFASLLQGINNRYNYKVRGLKLSFPNLPNAFDGYKIVHISDIHSGSLNNAEAVLKGVEKINDLNPDIIFFTGDLVNNKSEEMKPFMDVFNKMKARHGVFSILGNHDYGDYIPWSSQQEKAKNFENLLLIHAQLGWRLLMNENVHIEHDGEHIGLIGVENTSFKRGFHKNGNLSEAYKGTEQLPFKILLSHDPSHWDGEVNKEYKDIDLTLSGHTHGMQFGIEIPWLKWSPIKYVYKQWAGLYQEGSQHIYVNRGFGFLGYPGRVGIMPEITLIELQKTV